jgi:hypothetical protein
MVKQSSSGLIYQLHVQRDSQSINSLTLGMMNSKVTLKKTHKRYRKCSDCHKKGIVAQVKPATQKARAWRSKEIKWRSEYATAGERSTDRVCTLWYSAGPPRGHIDASSSTSFIRLRLRGGQGRIPGGQAPHTDVLWALARWGDVSLGGLVSLRVPGEVT